MDDKTGQNSDLYTMFEDLLSNILKEIRILSPPQRNEGFEL